jgi:DNA-binding transcriptional MocR family regulator
MPELAGLDAASGMNMPPEPEDGSLRDRITSGISALLAERIAPFHYQPPGGAEPFRASAAAFLARTLPGTAADQIVITAGSQNALHGIAALLLAPGARLAAGCFTYPGLLSLARRCGAELVGIEMDAEGLVPDSIEAAAKRKTLAALYLVPTNDNPTTATMGVARRRAIAALAGRYGFALIEDDAYGRLREDPLPPVTLFAPELGWHITTFSKLISPALRTAFVRVPSVRDAFALAAATHESAVMAPPINVALVARWIDDGSLERLLASVRAESATRVADASSLFAGRARWQPEGYHLWLPLAEGVPASQVAGQAIAAGLPAVPSATFAVDPANPVQALRISLGGSATRARVAREVRRLEAMLGGSAGLV